MFIVAMQVVETMDHPDADALRVYIVEAPELAPLQVVANDENSYAVGDVAAVARVGAVLNDGTRIRKAKLRGVDSFGMLLGKVDDPVGSDLTERFGRAPLTEPDPAEAPPVIRWTSVELLHHVRRTLDGKAEVFGDGFLFPKVTYRAKVKLDGTNAGVQLVPPDGVFAQSRSRVLSLSDDNCGFAAWVNEHRALFAPLAEKLGHAVIYGEWCGQGIQKRTAVSRIGRKVFAVFALQRGDHRRKPATLQVRPRRLRALLPDHPDIAVLPWHGQALELDFGDRASLERAAERINALVAEVEGRDPWVADTFGVDGTGEGVVLYPDPDALGTDDRDTLAELMFKAKGEKHQVVKQKKPAQLDPEVAASIEAFVDLFVTEPRLQQAVAEGCGGVVEMKRMGLFLKWLAADIIKESPAELEAAGLTWKQVNKAVTSRARAWFKDATLR